eukprot:COSAG06_NODE_64736_length_258_cov_2.616352_1_plen_40_part_10
MCPEPVLGTDDRFSLLFFFFFFFSFSIFFFKGTVSQPPQV